MSFIHRRIKINKMNLKLFINLKFIYFFSLKYCAIKHSLGEKKNEGKFIIGENLNGLERLIMHILCYQIV